MPKPLDPILRAAILEAIRAGGTCRGIAKQQGVAPSTVAKIARDNGLTFERTQTKNATEAHIADGKAARALESLESITIAAELREKLRGAKGGRDAQGWATAYGIMADKHMAFERFDSDHGADSAKGMLGALAAGLQAAYEQLGPTDDES